MYVNARAIIERETSSGTMILIQVRNKPYEGGKWLELPGGRVEEFESLAGDYTHRGNRHKTRNRLGGCRCRVPYSLCRVPDPQRSC
jgi:8-oxo-dGTP pyrophosphatase MutT (NUDIX family)